MNVEGTVNVLEAARQVGVKKLTLASSSSVYGVNAKVPFAESGTRSSTAISPYAASKLACEALGHVYHHIYGLDIAMLRFFNGLWPRPTAGPGDPQVRQAHQRRESQSRSSAMAVTARDYTYITDIVDGVLACTQQEFGYEVFNLGESQTVEVEPTHRTARNRSGQASRN